MTGYVLSNEAENDLRKIYRYSLEEFGELKATAYFQSLDECFQTLATNPDIGKDINHIRRGYFQFTHDRHAVFYRKKKNSIFIVRILHGSMATDHHL